MKYFKFVLIGIMALTMLAEAGSYFASKVNGLGLRRHTTTVRGLGLGNTGLAGNDSLALNFAMVSQWRRIKNTRAMASMQYQRFDTQTSVYDASYISSTANFSGLSMAIPVIKHKWIFGVSLQPYTVSDFSSTQDIVLNESSIGLISQIEGSVNKAQFNLIWSPMDILGLGASLNYYYGAQEHRYFFTFEEPDFTDPDHVVRYNFSGPGLGLSMDVSPIKQVSIAGFIDFKADASLDVEYESPVIVPDTSDRNFESFPMTYGVGAAVKFGPRTNVTADYVFQKWSEALKPGTAKTTQSGIEDWNSLGVGIERTASRKRSASFLNRYDWRLGFSTSKLGYQFNNASVNETAVHVGIGMPFGFYNNRFDVGLMMGVRGDEDTNLASERFIDLQFSLAVGELWFVRPR